MTPKNQSIISGIAGTSGSGQDFKIKRPTLTEKLYLSEKVVYLRRNMYDKSSLVFDIAKNRSGPFGKVNLPEAIKFCAEMLCQFKFDNSNNMFQESLKLRLCEVMKKVLMEDDQIPSSKAIKDYIEGGNLK